MTDTRAIPSAALGPSSAREVSGALLARVVLGRVPQRLKVTLGAFGTVELVNEGVRARGPLWAEHIAFGLSRGLSFDASPDISSAASSGQGPGRLAIECAFAHHVVSVALGERGAAISVGPLGLGARGIVAGFVAGVLEGLGTPLAISLAPLEGEGPAGPDIVNLAIRISAAQRQGWAELEIPASWLADAARLPTDPVELGALEVDATVELARTFLMAGELAGIDVGDAIVFDGERALTANPGTDWPARVVLGDFAAESTVGCDGRVSLLRAFRPMVVMAAAPVEVVAELGRIILRGPEVVTLGAGTVLALGRARGTSVALRVAGEVRAEGELVDVQGDLAVRLTARRRAPISLK